LGPKFPKIIIIIIINRRIRQVSSQAVKSGALKGRSEGPRESKYDEHNHGIQSADGQRLIS